MKTDARLNEDTYTRIYPTSEVIPRFYPTSATYKSVIPVKPIGHHIDFDHVKVIEMKHHIKNSKHLV